MPPLPAAELNPTMFRTEMAADGECCYLCNECPSSFTTLTALENHLTGHILAKAFQAQKQAMTESVPESAPDEGPAGSAGSPAAVSTDEEMDMDENDLKPGYHCRFCPNVFQDKTQLTVHYTHTHRDKPLYECEVCHTVFAVKRELSTHMRIHSGEQPHSCTQCGKEFGTRQLLKKHWMWHTGERSHVCPHCNKAFFQKGHLTQHLMIHAGGRPHQCTLCQKTFIFKFDLNRHMKIHAEREFSCGKCGRSFMKQAGLDDHVGKCKGRSSISSSRSSHSPAVDIKRPAPAPPLFMQSVLPFSQDDIAKLAQSILANKSGLSLLAPPPPQSLLPSTPLRPLPTLPTSVPPATLPSSTLPAPLPQLPAPYYCLFCQKQFPSQSAFTVHLSLAHFQNGVLDPTPQREPETTQLALETFVKDEPEDENAPHSNTATNSSCASSPQKPSPAGSSSPFHSAFHAASPECTACERSAGRMSELQRENEKMKEQLSHAQQLLRAVSGIAGQLAERGGASMGGASFDTTLHTAVLTQLREVLVDFDRN